MSTNTKQPATKTKAPDAVLPAFDAPAQPNEHITTIVMKPIIIEDMDGLARIAKMMADSEMFKDARTAARAGVKIMLGMELGIGPLASMRGIQVSDDGNINLAANLQAALVQRSGRYNYHVVTHDSELCVVDWFERNAKGAWEKIGTTSLSINEAKGAGMDMQSLKGGGKQKKYTWEMFPSDMLYARCITRGVKRFCPSVTNGITLYDPDELLGLPDGKLESVEITNHGSDPTAAQAMEGKAVDTSKLASGNPTPAPTIEPAPVAAQPAQNQTTATPAPATTTEAGSATETPSNASPAPSGEVSGTTTEAGSTTEAPAPSGKPAQPEPPTRDDAIKFWQTWAGKMKALTEPNPATNKLDYPEQVGFVKGALQVNGAKTGDDVDILIAKGITLRNGYCNITGTPRTAAPGEKLEM